MNKPATIEAKFHSLIKKYLSKKQQGLVMHEFRSLVPDVGLDIIAELERLRIQNSDQAKEIELLKKQSAAYKDLLELLQERHGNLCQSYSNALAEGSNVVQLANKKFDQIKNISLFSRIFCYDTVVRKIIRGVKNEP